MSRVVRILHLEDDLRDAEIVADALAVADFTCEIVRVESRVPFEEEVLAGAYDLILSDYRLPGYDGAAALAFAREHRPDVPVVVVSGALGEEAAITRMVAGATDYVLKDGLWRLVPSLRRALREAENRRSRRQVEQALRSSEQRYRGLFDASADGILLLDADTSRILDANPATRELLGYTTEQLLGRTPAAVGLCGSDAATAAALAELGVRDQVRHAGVRLTAADGTSIDVEFVASTYKVDTQRIIQLNIRDIRRRLHLETQLRQAQKLEAVGRLAGGIAHDFNNLLTIINSYTEAALMTLSRSDPLRTDLEQVHRAGVGASKLTSQLLAFSRKQVMRLVVCSLNQVVVELEPMLRRVAGRAVELVLQLDQNLGPVLADPGQVEQVLMNLVVNSRDAMSAGGRIVVSTANEELPVEGLLRNDSDPQPGRYVSLSVSDTGTGMDEGTAARMFEPFFTTKEPGKGTGLGLSGVYGIIKQSGGHINVDTKVGKGTTVRIYLPRQQGVVESRAISRRSVEPRTGNGESILLVEDDPAVRSLVQDALTRAGYDVSAVDSAAEALVLAGGEHARRIDLLLTDVIMPGMNGYELAAAILAIQPSTKVLCMSGYAPETLLGAGGRERDLPLISKPFSINDVLRRVAALVTSEG